ncbi:MAG TPA: hypothetical protein VIC06_13485 [Solirubrobacteraceae bacterium]|jgi:hypothetical protein
MISCEAQRTLVKSPPELWTLLSDPESLARHLGELGEIRIVRTEPESAVDWEGEGITGTVQLKASGWGTKVTLTAMRQPPAPPEPEPEPVLESEPEPVLESEPAPVLEPEPAPEPKLGFFARIFRRRPKLAPIPEPEPEVQEKTQAEEPQAPEPQADIAAELLALEESSAAETTAVLTAMLDKLGAAHHRPFSRS